MSDAVNYAEETLIHFKQKADHNKSESLTCLILILIFSLTAPLFITLGRNDLLGKIIPSILSISAGGITTWLQLRKPQKLWGIYRDAERQIENQMIKHRYKIDEYASHQRIDSLLVGKIAEIKMSTHKTWIDVIPSPESLNLNEKSSRNNRIE